MLKTKEDIKAQKVKDGGQMELPDLVKDKKAKIKSQKFVTYSLLVTLSLSCLLWAFTEAKKYIRQEKTISFNLPARTPNPTKAVSKNQYQANVSIKDIISNYIDSDSLWSFYITKDSNLVYEQNSDKFNQPISIITENLLNLDQSTANTFSSNLPQGLTVIENLVEGKSFFQSELLITLPNLSQITIISKNSSSSDISKPTNILNSLIPELYWNLVQMD